MTVAVATSLSHRITRPLYYRLVYHPRMWGVLAFLLLDQQPIEPPRCTASADRGNELLDIGDPAGALAEYERAISCAPSVQLHARAAVAACRLYVRGRNGVMAAKAKRHLAALPTQLREKIRPFCIPPSFESQSD